MKAFVATVVTAGLLAWGASGLVAQNGNDLFQQALVKERTAGDLNAAIALYQTIVQKHASDRALVAKALVQIGACYEKLGSGDAIKTYERVVREFSNEKESVATARSRLAALQSTIAAPPGLTARQIPAGTGVAEFDISPDGRYAAFFSDGNRTLSVRDLVTGATVARPASVSATDGPASGTRSVAFSPDGRQVAYTWRSNTHGNELRILSVSGAKVSPPRIVHRFSQGRSYAEVTDWTPDANHLVAGFRVGDGTWAIGFFSVTDGSVRVLKSLGWNWGTQVQVSPDGRYVAYDLPQGAQRAGDIFLLAADGSRETVLEHPASDCCAVWAPDGSQILFMSDRSGRNALYAVPVTNGQQMGPARIVKDDIGDFDQLKMSRSGVLYYRLTQRRRNVYLAELDASMKSTGPAVPATDQFIHSNGSPAWSRDGQYLAYYSLRAFRGQGPGAESGAGPGFDGGLVIQTRGTGEERYVPLRMHQAVPTAGRVYFPNENGAGLQWFPDGRSVLIPARVLSSGPRPVHLAFYKVDVVSGGAELLFETETNVQGLNPGLSPDGRSVFYVIPDPGHGKAPDKLSRFDLESRRETVLKRGQLTALAVSPDGARLAYVVVNPLSSRQEIEIVSAAGGEPRSVSLGDMGNGPLGGLAFSPDQGSLFFVRAGQLWRVAVTGGEPDRTGIAGIETTPHVHPDGRQIAFEKRETPPFELWALENFLPKPRATK
jgi:Tol biopolymer transport system component